MGLADYRKKRAFDRTTEPRGKRKPARKRGGLQFVVQKHGARRLHYDFRLELDGVLKSWAVPKGPSLDPGVKRLAVQVEDHPVEYGSFEGTIPAGEYGAGAVIVWDRGTWLPEKDPRDGLQRGRLEFELSGKKLRGSWVLVRMRDGGGDKNWLLIKRSDDAASAGDDVVEALPDSVKSGRPLEAVRARARTPALRGSASARFVAPQLATLVEAAPAGDEWIHEIKLDGYRMQAQKDGDRVRWTSRNGLDWTARFGALSPAIARLPARRALLDGEMVVFEENGSTSFQALQNTLSGEEANPLVFCAFDLLALDGRDLRDVALEQRKRALAVLLGRRRKAGAVRFSEHVTGDGVPFFEAACAAGLEGIISKRRAGRYVSGRSRDWQKVKCGHEQECVIVGYTRPAGARVGIGALGLAVREKAGFRYVGRVGTGFDRATLRGLARRLESLRVDAPAVAAPALLPAEARRGMLWVEPVLVAQVAFRGWTRDHLLRQASFKGLREDKSAVEVVRERPRAPRAARPAARRAAPRSAGGDPAGIAISHADRVLDRRSRITKGELARYYEWIAPRMLPFLTGRPLAVLRCPRGAGEPCFFQKHGGSSFPEAVGAIEVAEQRKAAQYLSVDSAAGLVALVQMGVIEFHPWGSRSPQLERPDSISFDLDPASDVAWAAVARAARMLRELLRGLGLVSFLKTTGGKGLHVIAPINPELEFDRIKTFARRLTEQVARASPREYIAKSTKAARAGLIFIDYLRNGRGATAVAPFSVRARPGLPIALPIAWSDLDDGVRSDEFDIAAVRARLARRRRDPWRAYFETRQSLRGDAKALALD